MAALAGVGAGGDQPQVVDTLAGRVHVRWDEGASATPRGQLVFLAAILCWSWRDEVNPTCGQRSSR